MYMHLMRILGESNTTYNKRESSVPISAAREIGCSTSINILKLPFLEKSINSRFKPFPVISYGYNVQLPAIPHTDPRRVIPDKSIRQIRYTIQNGFEYVRKSIELLEV
ncbi:hypothetical protein I7I50_11540 [Histoplasma capsulatum G186AR]|uniref:Uncharacterized protein n=1 Tax=Ajellomyces capsulatus TaxID=5037 RepID=A0A8H8D814_AJECA|nr:hypothetical protein I7I52_02777 [Histoplasma capsulatum]QSS70042.1 hypothetical protein I7I50_11540 [Histoplasma capsulatum G186AR]